MKVSMIDLVYKNQFWIFSNTEESKHLETINEELQHEKGALCSLLQALQDTEVSFLIACAFMYNCLESQDIA